MRHAPRYSVVIASRNEGDALRKTVDEVLRHAPPASCELVVVDDASEDGSCDWLRAADLPVTVVRNDERRGLIFSRARGADLAQGHYLFFLDAHCALSPDLFSLLEAELQGIGENGLAVPTIYYLRPADWAIDYESPPATGCSIENPFLDFSFTGAREIDGRTCTCTIGGGAWMCARAWYDRIGGLDRGMTYWGGENVDIPLRTWVAGGHCVVARSAAVGHLFKRNPGNPTAGSTILYNKIRAAHTVFEKPTFERILESLALLPGFEEAQRRAAEDREGLIRLKDRMEALRARSDRWLIETFELPVLEAPFLHRSWPRGRPAERPLRPHVSVILPWRGSEVERKALPSLISSILETTAYGRYEILVCGGEAGSSHLREGVPSSRVRSIETPAPAPPGVLVNVAAAYSDAEYLAVLAPDAVVTDEHWIERFLVLFERRPRLLMASPQLVPVDGEGRNAPEAHRGSDQTLARFDLVHSEGDDELEAVRERRGEPFSPLPYQALAVPGTFLFLRKDAFRAVGGFDRTLVDPTSLALDLAINAWLSGYEVFCYPGAVAGARAGAAAGAAAAEDRVMTSLKYSTSSARLARLRERHPDIEALLHRQADAMRAARRDFLARARFDEDWLWYKFGEDMPMEKATAGRAVGIELELRISYPDEIGQLARILKVLREAGAATLAHLVYRVEGGAVGTFLCEKPAEAALAIQGLGLALETDTVVVVRTENRPGALGHLVSALEAERIGIAYTYAAARGDELIAVLSTDDNPKAEDVLRAYLIRAEPADPAAP